MFTQKQHDQIASDHREELFLMFVPWIFCFVGFIIITVLYFYFNIPTEADYYMLPDYMLPNY